MSKNRVIDADAHIVETDALWEELEGQDKKFRPLLLSEPKGKGQDRIYWNSDGIMYRHMPESDVPLGIRDLTDVPGRLRKMDEMGVDVQVIYPTFFLMPYAKRTEAIVALSRCYNRFMAKASVESGGRLRWVVVVPVPSMTDAIAELDFGKKHGACGISLRGVEYDRILSDSYFYPLYEKAEALDFPVCVHVGTGNLPAWQSFKGSAIYVSRGPVLAAFQDFLLGGITDRFPKLRFGFIEAGATWIPYVISEITRRGEWLSKGSNLASLVAQEMGGASKETAQSKKDGGSVGDESLIMRANRLYVSCRISDDLDYLKKWAGNTNLVTGTDYGHDDYSTDLEAFSILRNKVGADIEFIDGVVARNAMELYGIR